MSEDAYPGSVSVVGVLDGWPISGSITHIERTGALVHCCYGILVAGYLEFEHEIPRVLVHAVITSALRHTVPVKRIGAIAVETESSGIRECACPIVTCVVA